MRALRQSLGYFSAAAVVLCTTSALAEEAKTGLPQLDPTLIPAQLFWLAVSFALLYGLMAFIALPVIRRTQDRRHAILSTELAAAAKANADAKAMIVQYEKALSDARAEAEAMVSEMATKAAKEMAVQKEVQQKDLNHRLAEAEAKITAARDAAIAEARAQADSLALMIVDKVINAGAR